MPSRVVVTGYGAITPLGLSVDETWSNLIAGINGIGPITNFDASGFNVKIAGEAKNFDPVKYMDPVTAKYSDRFTQFAVSASLQALQLAKITINEENKYDFGIIIGSGVGGLGTLEKQVEVLNARGPAKVSPYIVPMRIADNASGQTSIKTQIKGFNMSMVSSCSTGTDAIGLAYQLIKYGEYKGMLVGGADAAITRIGVAGFTQAGALTRNADTMKDSRPFDAKRDGFVIGEGAGVLFLEALEHAAARGIPILAEIAGYGATSDAYHITHPSENGDSGTKAIQLALRSINPEDVQYINAHGTSTPLNDLSETRVIKRVFGQKAYNIPVSSIKSMLGHMLGAAGAVEAIVCCKVVQEGILPPTINYEFPDTECDLDYVPNKAREKNVGTAISNSFGFGGHNSVLTIKKFTNS
ncbi:MAG: beta-ketoacyl-[acyl-carrier-protein] synthase II [Chloroflexi bacterium RBG_16_48_7]|nr:MAG: beta-ketoacyl-[acyl-carrier-protein] synthase II [Chloroflexi bacterium RBG_16_48_7]